MTKREFAEKWGYQTANGYMLLGNLNDKQMSAILEILKALRQPDVIANRFANIADFNQCECEMCRNTQKQTAYGQALFDFREQLLKDLDEVIKKAKLELLEAMMEMVTKGWADGKDKQNVKDMLQSEINFLNGNEP